MWNVDNNQTVFLYHPATKLFVGQPKKSPLHALQSTSDSLSLPMVSDLTLLQPIQLQNFRLNDKSKKITTATVFTLLVSLENRGMYKIHTPIFSAHHIAEGPPASVHLFPVTDLDKTPQRVDPQTSWVFRPASSEQILRNDDVLHYGMPVHIMKANGRRFLRLDLTQEFLAVHSSPVQETEMDIWIMYPTSSVSICVNPQSQFCHYVEGNQIGKLLFECKYDAKTSDEITCVTKEKHPVYTTESECHALCQWPSYQCSGPPLYQCVAQPPSPNTTWQDFDTCTLDCLSPTISGAETTQQSGGKKQITSSLPDIDVQAWVMWIFVAIGVIGAIILGIRALKRSTL